MADLGEMFRAPGVRFWRRLPGPIERVWAHLTDPTRLSGWYDAGSVIEPRGGGAGERRPHPGRRHPVAPAGEIRPHLERVRSRRERLGLSRILPDPGTGGR